MDEYNYCVVCGQLIEYVNHLRNHHCQESVERRKLAIQRRESEPYEHGLSEAVRLNFGLELLSMNGDS